MADHLGWIEKVAALDVALAGASPLLATVGNDLRNELTKAGQAFDSAFRTGSDPGESAGHIAWRSQVAGILGDLDSLARGVDGGPATTIDPANPLASSNTVSRRAAGASSGANPLSKSVLLALSRAFPLPPEPPRFTVLDAALSDAIAQVDAFIAAL